MDVKKNKIKSEKQLGQTLIETLVAIFILVMGITAAVGLAIYAYSSSGSVVKQVIATGLAREGLEAVRNMRDTNWLQDSISTDCYDYASTPPGQNTAKCYKKWIGDPQGNGGGVPYCLNPTGSSHCHGDDPSDSYSLGFVAANPGTSFWTLTQQTTPKFGLNFDSTGVNGLYPPSNSANGTSEYYRKITITKDSTAPFNHPAVNTANPEIGPKVLVKVQVWWTDKKCPRVADYTVGMKCSLELDTYLTNWKNY